MRLYKLVTTDNIEGAQLTWHGTKKDVDAAARAAKLEYNTIICQLMRRAEEAGEDEVARQLLADYDGRQVLIVPVEFECTRKGVLQLLQNEIPQHVVG